MKSVIFKTALSLLIALALVCCAGCAKKNSSTDGPSPEGGDFTFALGSAEGKAGEDVEIPLTIRSNPSIAGYSVTVCYDPAVLTFKSCDNKVSGGFAVTNSTVPGKVRVMCTVMGGNALAHEGVCDLLTFTVKEDAPAGTSTLELILADSADAIYKTENGKMPPVECILEQGSVTVK